MYNTSFNETLLPWYTQHRRNLPWRQTTDPYAIWLSEIMLQQTQVDTVIPYYHRWLRRYPTIEAVAEAELESLLKLWEGLGYYQRCRHFWEAAKQVRNRFRGKIPQRYDDFRSLPGVGDYTAAAVLSIAFGQPYPVLDGNVKRFMARYRGIRYFTPTNLRRITAFLANQIRQNNPGDFNQAIMEIGARICRPRKPLCADCPVQSTCRAFARGQVESYPRKTVKKPIPEEEVVVGLLWKDNRFLITRRKETGHLGGLWELPGGKVEAGEALEAALKREFWEECGVNISVGNRVGVVRHAYSHFKIHLTLFHCYPLKGTTVSPIQPFRWIFPSDINSYPFPKANHKLFSLCNSQEWIHD